MKPKKKKKRTGDAKGPRRKSPEGHTIHIGYIHTSKVCMFVCLKVGVVLSESVLFLIEDGERDVSVVG